MKYVTAFDHHDYSLVGCVWVRSHASFNSLPNKRIQTSFRDWMDFSRFQYKRIRCSSRDYGKHSEGHYYLNRVKKLILMIDACMQKRVIKTKSVEFMPLSLSFFLTLNAIMWFFYGLLLNDYYIAVS